MSGERAPGAAAGGPERAWMRRALALARRGWGRTAPNPMVGAVVVRDGLVVGEGYHAGYGEAHAETVALAAAGERARGATVYVTLEPCNHQGRTPPCVDALIAAGVRRVIAATSDPTHVASGGADRLRAAGIKVEFGVGEPEARELNAAFFFAATGVERPWLTLKLAISIDGGIAAATREQRWLTGEAARRYVHRLRAASDAVAVGIGTVLADDPALTVRHGRRPRISPIRVVFDSTARLPIDSRLVKSARRSPVLVLSEGAAPAAVAAIEQKGVVVENVAGVVGALRVLHRRGVRSLLVEGGAGLAGALLGASVVDRLIIIQAPVILGPGALSAFGSAPPVERLRVIDRRELGDDLVTEYAVREL